MNPIYVSTPLWIIAISTAIIAIFTILIAAKPNKRLPKCELSLEDFVDLSNSIKPIIAYKSDYNNHSKFSFIHDNIIYFTNTDSAIEFADEINVVTTKIQEW